MGCNCGKSFSSYATGQRLRSPVTSHVPTQRPVTQVTNIQSKSLQARNQATATQQASSGRRKV